MSDPSIAFSSDRAAGRHVPAGGPTMAGPHRELRRDVEEHDRDSSVEGLALLVRPGLSTLRRRFGPLDRDLVSAARRGGAVGRLRDRSGSPPADGSGRERSDGRRRPEPRRIGTGGRRLGCPRAVVVLLSDVLEGGGDAPDLVRASMLLDARGRLAPRGSADPATLDRLRRWVDHVLPCLPRIEVASADDPRRRVRLFGDRQGHGDEIVGIALADSVERDRRRLGLAPAGLA